MAREPEAAERRGCGESAKHDGTGEARLQQFGLAGAPSHDVVDLERYADAEKDTKLPKYESWNGYGPFLPMNIERYYDFWNRGI